MLQAIIKKSTEDNIQRIGNDVANQVAEALSRKYEFDLEEAMEFMGKLTITDKTSSVKEATIPLPFCGVIEDNWCQAIKSNNKLFTQCRKNRLFGSNLCKGCCTAANKNNGKPTYGFIQERLNDDYTDKDGKKPKNYGNVMKTLGITREAALAEAEKLGWTIPEKQFDVIVKKSGRPPKETKSSSDEEDIIASAIRRANKSTKTSDEEDNTPRKRKKKINTVITTDTSDEDSLNHTKKQVKVKEEEIQECDTNIDDEEFVLQEIGIEATEVTDSDGTTWMVDHNQNVYDDQENVIGRWDDINKNVIRDGDISEDDGDISDLSDDELS